MWRAVFPLPSNSFKSSLGRPTIEKPTWTRSFIAAR